MVSSLCKGSANYFGAAETLREIVPGVTYEQIDHTLKFMLKNNAIIDNAGIYRLNVTLDDQFIEHLQDLLEYGLVKYNAEYTGEKVFLLWHSYSMNQVQLKLLKDPDYNMKGTYIYGKTVVIFASLKKDASVEERLAYKDKYLTSTLFQWESENNVKQSDLEGLLNSDEALIFIRKVESEHGIVQPFIYTGKGKLTNPRRQDKIDSTTGKPAITYLFDIQMVEELPDYLQYDFGVEG